MFDSDSFFMCFWLPISIVIGVIIGGVFLMAYCSSCVSAKMYNQQNNTTYSCSDFLWAKDQINSQTQTIKLK